MLRAINALFFPCFNTQPPEGGWLIHFSPIIGMDKVSTHSRPKAAGFRHYLKFKSIYGFNTQPPEGGWGIVCKIEGV